MFDQADVDLAGEVLSVLRQRGFTLAVAESCTGGLLGGLLTEIPGASDVFGCGFVTYSNAAKQAMLGVEGEMLDRHGAVSDQVAQAMARGALRRSQATLAAAITGIAGPTGGGSEAKPVGLVFIAAAMSDRVWSARHIFAGDRTHVRLQSVRSALELIIKTAGEPCPGAC